MPGLLLPLLLATATAEPLLPLAELPAQTLAPNSCAMFLWDRGSERRVLMAIAQPPTIRINNGGVRNMAQRSASGAPVMGFAPNATYADQTLTITLALTIKPDAGGIGGAVIRDGVMTMTGRDGAAIITPVAGLIGCQTEPGR
jgi:hypothetical protein